jgi:tetratricopeptide (TPR) repeat protein
MFVKGISMWPVCLLIWRLNSNCIMKKLTGVAVFVFVSTICFGQMQALAVDSMKAALAKSTTLEAKAEWLDLLSRTLMNVDLAEADKYGEQFIEMAEESRDRRLMIKAYMSNGVRSGYFAGSQDYAPKAMAFFEKALAIARQNRYDDATGAAYLRMAILNLQISENEKALNYANQAFSIISTLKDDSLSAESHNVYGQVYLARNDKILALRHYLTALRTAEERKARQDYKASLLRSCYINLSNFYSNIEDNDRALDYFKLANKMLDDMTGKNVPYMRVIDINGFGKLFAAKKNDQMAISYFERSLRMADSLNFSSLKMPAYTSLLNQYLRMDQPKKALAYFNSSSGKNLQEYLNKFGFTGVTSQAYGVIYTELGQYDSAKIYFEKARPYFERSPSEVNKLNYFAQVATLYEKTGEYKKSIELLLQVKAMAEKNGILEGVEKAAKHLDTLYAKTDDFKQASFYNSLYYQYKDSIEKLGKEKELAQIEAGDEQSRQQRIMEEEAEKERRKNNIQYMAITIGIVMAFLLLVVLGMFKVSASTIKMIGFFAFLMFFEFIFLIFKKNIHGLTHGEPWKDLSFMIGLAAILLPLHHWLEEKVIHYLTSHNRLTAAGHHIRTKLFRSSKAGGH